LELIGKENVKLSRRQMDDLIELVNKEEAIELDEQALRKMQRRIENRKEEKRVDEGEPALPSTPPIAIPPTPRPPQPPASLR
jgi:LETM1 and EF-hand domain-containing protein 1